MSNLMIYIPFKLEGREKSKDIETCDRKAFPLLDLNELVPVVNNFPISFAKDS
jgi:hypothetical protein